jgi:hypothetical protein
MIWFRVTCLLASVVGLTSTCSCRSAWPKVDTLLTPARLSSFGTITQRAATDMSIMDHCLDVRPMSITSLVEETGCTMTGGLDTFGRTNAPVSRSCTSCRAVYRSVPGAKCSSMSERPSIESLVTSVTSSTPSSRFFESGVVTSDSTSGAESPGASVCMSTVTGEVSGSTSAGIRVSWRIPRTMTTAASAITSNRNRMQASMIERKRATPR